MSSLQNTLVSRQLLTQQLICVIWRIGKLGQVLHYGLAQGGEKTDLVEYYASEKKFLQQFGLRNLMNLSALQ